MNLTDGYSGLKNKFNVKNVVSGMGKEKKGCWIFWIIMVIFSLILYGPSLFGNKTLLYPNMVSDNISQFLPRFINSARNFAESGKLITYSMEAGWGSVIGSYNPFDILVIIFGEQNVVSMLPIRAIVRIFLAGGCFYAYLRKMNYHLYVCCFFGFCYSFSTQLVMNGNWQAQAEIAIFLAAALWGCELVLREKRPLVLFLSFAFLYFVFSTYYQLVYGVVVVLYFLLRYWVLYAKEYDRRKKRRLLLIVLAIAVVGAVIFFPSVYDILMSQRVKSNLSEIKEIVQKTFSGKNLKQIYITFCRSLSPNAYGIPGIEEFYGQDSYMSDGGFYYGIVSILLIPQILKKPKENIWSILGIFVIGIFTCVPFFRFILNGFSSDSFKLCRMIFNLILVLMAADIMNRIIEKKQKFSWGIFLFTIVFLEMALYLSSIRQVYTKRILLVYFFLILYLVVIFVGKRKNNANIVKCGMGIVTLLELSITIYPLVNNEDTLTKEAYENGYYNDGTAEAVASIEDTGFYRIQKDYKSVMNSDAEVQNYNGVLYYKGGIQEKSVSDFIMENSLATKNNNLAFFEGVIGNPRMAAAFSVQYYLSKGNTCYEYGYEKVGEEEGINIYKTEYYVPFGSIYYDFMKQSDYQVLSEKVKKDVFSKYCVLEDSEFTGEIEASSYVEHVVDSPVGFDKQNYVLGEQMFVQDLKKNQTIVITCKNAGGQIPLKVRCSNTETKEQLMQSCSIYESDTISVEFSNLQGDYNFWVYGGNGEEGIPIDLVNVTVYDSDDYYQIFRDNISERKSSAMTITSKTNEKITGHVSLEREGMVYFPLRKDSSYQYLVNGERVDTICVNGIFTGIYLEPGDYEIVIENYIDLTVKKIIFVVIVSIAISLTLWEYLQKKRRKENEIVFTCKSN